MPSTEKDKEIPKETILKEIVPSKKGDKKIEEKIKTPKDEKEKIKIVKPK